MGQIASSETQSFPFGDRYIYEEKLGEGAFGEVFKVHHKDTNKVYALKNIKCVGDEDLANVVDEMKSLGKLNHRNIMKLFDIKCQQKEAFKAHVSLLFEYCPGGNLNQRLEKSSPNALNLKWMRQLADAIAYLHSEKLVHRDLKPDNILLTSHEDIKIGDFGLSREFVAMKEENQTWEAYYMATGCGTLFYIAPEVFFDHYTEKADIFALGILFYAIEERGYLERNGTKFYGVFVQEKDGDELVPLGLEMYIDKTGVRVTFDKTGKELAVIIGSALLFDQKKRPSAATIKQQLNNYMTEC